MRNWLTFSLGILGAIALVHSAFGQSAGAQASERHLLHANTPPAAALAQRIGPLPKQTSLRLALSLPLRNREALDQLLRRLYDPSSADYRRYLTPSQFTERFGPTQDDYQSVLNFAKSNNLAVTATHDSRLLLDVRGNVPDIEKAFHVKLQNYQHPRENRHFFAPDSKPWVAGNLPMLDVAGLSDFATLRPASHGKLTKKQSGSAGGSSPIVGDYMGQDFRNAYAPGVSLQGSGQRVGLFEADGYYMGDITNYEAYEILPSVPLQNVLIDGFNGAPGVLNPEVATDIEMAIAMAPGLDAVVVFESSTNDTTWIDILDAMASSNQIKQFSSSWGFTTADTSADPDTAFDAIFQKMAAQGQTFFQASGDGDAWVSQIWVPADSPYVTSVGGTSLNMNGPGVSYASESVWNSGYGPPGWPITDNGYWGSGGGVSTVYPIPYWQQGVSMALNHGSISNRNIPDVAMTATNIFITANSNEFGSFFGTSCSAPLWAGFAALINEQAANSNMPPVGFLNPALYALGQGPNYELCFHDITAGSNTFAGSPSNYFAAPGFDLCTGWGTPSGINLINALAGVYQPTITSLPVSQTNFAGTDVTFSITATGFAPLFYQWQFDGTNLADATMSSFIVSNALETNNGNYTVVITNQWGSVTSSVAALTVEQAASVVTWPTSASITYGTALTSAQLDATANVPGSFVFTPASGTILPAAANKLSVVFTPFDTVDFSNATNSVSLVVLPAQLTISANDETKTYGNSITFAGTEFNVSGLVNGDTVSNVSLTSPGSSVTATTTASPYVIVPAAAVGTGLANYAITYFSGLLTVNPAFLTITANNQAKIYGQAVNFAGTEFTVGGLVNGDAVARVSLQSPGSLATATVAGSPYNISSSGAVGTGLGNYTITYGNGSMTVTPATLTLTANNQSKNYGQTVNFAGTEFSAVGLANSDSVARVTLQSPGSLATATVAGSPYNILSGTAVGTGLGNYAISYANGTMTVNPAPLTVTANKQTKTYGQTVSFAGTEFATSGLQNSDAVSSVVLTSSGAAATATVANSPYAIALNTAVGTGLNNYAITYLNGTLTVSPACLTITADNQTKPYGQLLTFAGTEFTTLGLLNADAVNSVKLTSVGAATNAAAAGSPYLIVPSAAVGSGLGNYTINYVNGALTITTTATVPKIQSVAQAGASFTFTWSATPTEMYQVQFATNLSQSAWANFGSPITATNSTLTASDAITNARRFYRVTVLP